ncbi:MAG: serine/threonine protein kinase [Chitinophagaceae bacterium]
MDNSLYQTFKVFDRSYLAILKKDIHALATRAGFKSTRLGECDIVISELAGNLVKHADEGLMLAKAIQHKGVNGIEVICIDNGPGMNDVKGMMVDGMSTKNTLGHGLGAIRRLSDFFQVYSQKEWGTIMVTRLFEEKIKVSSTDSLATHTIIVPKHGETECGDAFFYKSDDATIQFFLADGLGHGHDAAEAVKVAGNAFIICPENDGPSIIRYISQSSRKTRGLVGTVVVFDKNAGKWAICGVGNIMTKLASPLNSKNYMSYNGIIGLNLPNTINAMEVTFEKDQLLIMCSDGIKSRWDVSKYPGLFRNDLSMMSATIFKDFNRNTDDTSVAVCKLSI